MQLKETIFCTEAIEDLDNDTDSLPEIKDCSYSKVHFFRLFKQIADFASDIGGQLGLWIGFSVLTIAEFIEFFMLLFAHLVKKCTSRGKVKSASLELKET